MRGDASTQAGAVDQTIHHVFEFLSRALAVARGQPLLIGISGLQGSGKSTLARRLCTLARQHGIACEALSLDDFYRGRRERAQLARAIHPLLATRGVPGSHDLTLLEASLAALAHASAQMPARLPRFDKGRDTRLPPSRWRRVTQAPRLILLEGWCVGVPAQDADALRRPVNALERSEDRDGHWRQWVNAQLADGYARLWQRLDRLIVLQTPAWDCVLRWRDEAEAPLRARGATRAMSHADLARFLMHFERLSRHALASLPARADACVQLDAQRAVRAIRVRPDWSE